ncbi:GntR family transcriptional regulator [Vagococcus vulneris]|uniref:GntR family transcriptional regulator n=1 Tax=Vagococcus vulneris TaxID=1977869 RepID=UPI0014037540|nr:GntR family transcriptional regulator [Vagococcus vulneris]
MFIRINPESETAIFLQLIFEIKRLVVIGELEQGDELPSVRSLSGDLGINMHTVNKSYKLLTEEGILEKTTKGFRVGSAEQRHLSGEREQDFDERLRQILIDAAVFNVTYEGFSQKQAKLTEEIMRGDN